jgi:glycosyltransferase involved in cell wall biosynthesis
LLKPKLLIVLNRLAVGGPAVNTLALAHQLSSDFEILLLAGEPAHGEESAAYLLNEYKGFEVKIIPSIKRAVLPFDDLSGYRQIKKIIREFQPHIIHTHGSKPGVLARIAAWRCKVPVIVHTYHGHVFHSYFNKLVSNLIIKAERWLAKKTSIIIAINERLQKELVSEYKIAIASNVILNRLGIDAEKMRDEEGYKRKKFRQEFQLSEEQKAVGIIGRLVPVKNHIGFLEAAEKMMNISTTQVKFFIVGDGDEKPKLQQLLKSKNIPFHTSAEYSNLTSPFIFTSWRKDMDVVLAGLDLIVLTSHNEGTPVSIMEAMAAGKPVIASNVGGISELFQNNQNGLLYQDLQHLPQLSLQLLTNPEDYSRISNNARYFAQSHLSLSAQVSTLKQAYFKVLKQAST